MTRSRVLELALRARWEHDTLEVYADALQAEGDPRGELIALDLEIASNGITPALARRRRQRLYEWLGGSTIARRPVHEASFRDGFVSDFVITHDRNTTVTEYIEALRASRAGAFVRGLTIHVGGPAQLAEAFAALVRTPWPWLERLAVHVVERGDIIAQHLVADVIAQTPRLHTLAFAGADAVGRFSHPGVRTFVTESPCIELARSLPQLETLDLVVVPADRGDDGGPPAALLTTIHDLPLRVLDLSRNEPSHPARDTAGIYAFVRWLPLDRVQWLRLPSLRTTQQIALLHETADLAPHTQFEVARTYTAHAAALAHVAHPRVTLPAPFVWSPGDSLSSRNALTITVPTEEHGDSAPLSRLVERLEAQFAVLPPNARAAWLDFWAFLDGLPWEDRDGHDVTRPFSAATLLTALEPLDDSVPYSGADGPWAQLAETLRSADLPPDAEVGVRRFWGW